MSYQRTKPVYQGLGIAWSDVTNALGKGAGALQTAADVAGMAPAVLEAAKGIYEDPYLKEVACNLARLKAVNAGQFPGPPCAPTPPGADPRKGLGLRYAITPLHAAVFVRQNMWVAPLAVAAIFGLPFLIGYKMGGK